MVGKPTVDMAAILEADRALASLRRESLTRSLEVVTREVQAISAVATSSRRKRRIRR